MRNTNTTVSVVDPIISRHFVKPINAFRPYRLKEEQELYQTNQYKQQNYYIDYCSSAAKGLRLCDTAKNRNTRGRFVYVFDRIDKNGDGHIDMEELRRLFTAFDVHNTMTEQELDDVFNQLDQDGDGKISRAEFHTWYTNSQELIRAQGYSVFDTLDTNRSGTLDKHEIRALLVELDPTITDQDVTNDALSARYKEGSREEITFEEFSEWYQKSILHERQKKAVEEDKEGVGKV